jgi:hypothetical protein
MVPNMGMNPDGTSKYYSELIRTGLQITVSENFGYRKQPILNILLFLLNAQY